MRKEARTGRQVAASSRGVGGDVWTRSGRFAVCLGESPKTFVGPCGGGPDHTMQRALVVVSLEEGGARLQRLEAEAANKPQDAANPAQLSDDPDWAAELEQLRGKVNELQTR